MEHFTEYIFNINDLLKIFVSDIQPGSSVDWNNIRCIASSLQFVTADPPWFWNFLTAITNVLQKYECRDIFVIAHVLQLALYRVIGCDIGYPEAQQTVLDIRETYYNVRDIEYYAVSSEFAKIFFVPYHELIEAHELDAVRDTVMCGNLSFLKLLLKFGAMMPPPQDSIMEVWNCRKIL